MDHGMTIERRAKMSEVQVVEEAVYRELHFLEGILPTCPKTLRPLIGAMLAERKKIADSVQESIGAMQVPLADEAWRYIEQDSKEG